MPGRWLQPNPRPTPISAPPGMHNVHRPCKCPFGVRLSDRSTTSRPLARWAILQPWDGDADADARRTHPAVDSCVPQLQAWTPPSPCLGLCHAHLAVRDMKRDPHPC